MGGHFEAWFLTWDELRALDNGTELFLLLLPMTGLEEGQQKPAEALISQRLGQIPVFTAMSDYIARCIVSGLVIEGEYTQADGIGITCTQNHCVRNVEKHPRYRGDVSKLNKLLLRLMK